MWTTVRTKKIVASHTVYALLEMEPFSEFLNEEKWRKFVHPNDLYKLLQAEEKLLAEGAPCSAEYRLVSKTGKHIHIKHFMQLSVNHDNEVKILSILDDLSEQKHAEVILEVMHEGFFELNPLFEFKRVNAATELLWHLHRDDLIGKKIWDVFPEAVGTPFYDAITTAVHEKKNVVQNVIGPAEGHWLHLSTTPFSDGAFVIFYDIQHEKQAEEEALKHHNILRQAEELAGAGSWEYDIATKQFTWSENFSKLFGLNKGAKVTPCIYVESASPAYKEAAQRLVDRIDKNFAAFEELLEVEIKGEQKFFYVQTMLFNNEHGTPSKVLGLNMDVTALHRSRQAITELNEALLEKNRALNTAISELKAFNSLAATDYKETLRHLYTSLEFIVVNDARNLSNASRANIRRAQSAIQKMKLITEDIISYSQLNAATEPAVDVELNDILKSVQHDMKIKIEDAAATIRCADCPTIHGHPQLLILLFHHLVDNALKFRKKDAPPEIQITAREQPGNSIDHPDAIAGKHYHVISVGDNGIGFDTSDTEKIFAMFGRLHDGKEYKGSGIGLAVCKKIMDLHNGFITVESEPGKGSVFTCYFPT
jgi:signal transduction histidine kinase